MQRRILYKIFSGLMLVVFCSGNFDFLILLTAGTSPTRQSSHHEKCYCSECYASHEGCLCWENPEAAQTPEPVAATDVFYKACHCSPQQAGGIFLSPEMKCLFHSVTALAPCFPSASDWPEDKLFFLTDLFAPPVFQPPEVC